MKDVYRGLGGFTGPTFERDNVPAEPPIGKDWLPVKPPRQFDPREPPNLGNEKDTQDFLKDMVKRPEKWGGNERPDNLQDSIENESGRGNLGADMRWELESSIREIEQTGKDPHNNYLGMLEAIFKTYEAITEEQYEFYKKRFEDAVKRHSTPNKQWPEDYKGF